MKRRVGISFYGLSHVSIQSGRGDHFVRVRATDTLPEVIHYYPNKERAYKVWGRAYRMLSKHRPFINWM